MPRLTKSQIVTLVDAAISAHIVDPTKRRFLLYGVPMEFVARLPTASAPREQLFSDLTQLNDETVVDHPFQGHICTWLENAIWLAGRRVESAFFQSMLNHVSKGEAKGNVGNSAGVTLHVLTVHNTRIDFSLANSSSGHWVVTRLFIELLHEAQPIDTGGLSCSAPCFAGNYVVPVSLDYQTYDIVPQIPDAGLHMFEYRSAEADHFSVTLSGLKAGIVLIRADVYDFSVCSTAALSSRPISITSDPDTVASAESICRPARNALVDDVSPATLKTLTAKHPWSFLQSLPEPLSVSVLCELRDWAQREGVEPPPPWSPNRPDFLVMHVRRILQGPNPHGFFN